MVFIEEERELDREPRGEVERVGAVQLADGTELSVEGGVSRFLGLYIRMVGGGVPGSMVSKSDALANRADEEGSEDAEKPSGTDFELVSSEKGIFLWGGRGVEQQSENDHQNGVWISHGARIRNRSIS